MVYLNSKIVMPVIFVVLIAAVYLVFFSQQYSFDDGVKEINSLWEKQDLKPSYLISPLKVYAIEKRNLIELKADLTSFKDSLAEKSDSEDKEKLILLTETEIELIDNALLQKENFNSIDFFDSTEYDFDILCNSMNKAEQLEENLFLQKSTAKTVNKKLKDFSSAYPEEAKKAQITGLALTLTSDDRINELSSVLSSLKVVC